MICPFLYINQKVTGLGKRSYCDLKFFQLPDNKKKMMNKVFEKRIKLNDGREIILETGKLAKQADGSVIVKMGETMLLASVVSAKEGRENADFMPLSVDYKEK